MQCQEEPALLMMMCLAAIPLHWAEERGGEQGDEAW